MDSPRLLLPGVIGLTINISQSRATMLPLEGGGVQKLLSVGSQQGRPRWDGRVHVRIVQNSCACMYMELALASLSGSGDCTVESSLRYTHPRPDRLSCLYIHACTCTCTTWCGVHFILVILTTLLDPTRRASACPTSSKGFWPTSGGPPYYAITIAATGSSSEQSISNTVA